jgi:predicted chitinase
MTNTSRLLALVAVASVTAACSGGAAEDTGSSASRISANCTSATAWATNVSYATGAIVSFDGADYECIQGHTSEPGWTPAAVPALWSPVTCTSGGGGSSSGGSSSGGSSSGSSGSGSNGGGSSSGGSTTGGPDCSAWVYMATADSCDGSIGESCGWTTANEGQGYHCKDMGTWVGCEPGGTCTATSSGGGSSSGGGTSSGGGSGTTSGTGLGAILSEATFDSMFPNRNSIYSYAGLVQAAAVYSAFATTGSSDDAKREVAGFLANVAHETGGLVYVDEIAQAVYCQPSADCPCASGQEYFGRGALQLSWNYNYCAAGQALGQNLQANPGLVSTTPALAWGTGVWFWMTSTGANGTTCHNGINSSGFGSTIQTINGGIECNGGDPSEVQDRVQYYTTYCSMLGVSPGSNTGC